MNPHFHGWMIVSELNEQKRTGLLEAFNQQKQTHVWYHTHRDNITNIKKFGILPLNEVKRRGLIHRNYSNDAVQDTRDSMGIHDYVNFYFTPRTTTHYVIWKNDPGYYNELVLLRIKLEDLLTDDSITTFKFTDGNAGSMYTKTFTEVEDVEGLPWQIIRTRSRSFTKSEGARRSSEVLVKPSVEIYPNTDYVPPSSFEQ